MLTVTATALCSLWFRDRVTISRSLILKPESTLDLDMSSPTKNPAAVALGRLGGAAATAAQKAAARRNGRKGGRPRTKKETKETKP
jgi:hypothetical protein